MASYMLLSATPPPQIKGLSGPKRSDFFFFSRAANTLGLLTTTAVRSALVEEEVSISLTP